MTQDLKRLNAPKSWPVPRKSNVWVTSPNPGPHSREGCMPLSVVLRGVLKVGDTYYMWYHAMDTVQWDGGHENGSICLARSADGIHWDKPELGLVEYRGHRRNNIVIGHGAAGLQGYLVAHIAQCS